MYQRKVVERNTYGSMEEYFKSNEFLGLMEKMGNMSL